MYNVHAANTLVQYIFLYVDRSNKKKADWSFTFIKSGRVKCESFV